MIEVFAVSVVNVPAAAVVPPITELSITAPSKFIATLVPVEENSASIVSRSLLSLVPQVSVAFCYRKPVYDLLLIVSYKFRSYYQPCGLLGARGEIIDWFLTL